MAIASDQDSTAPKRKRVVVPLLKASAVAALVFAVSWLRWPLSLFNFESVGVIFVGYGILITIFAMVLGIPLARLLEKRRTGAWWSYLAAAAATGALLAALFSSSPHRPRACEHALDACVENPHAVHLAFSPWTRSYPGWVENPPIAMPDFVGSIIFGAVVGAALGLSFWYFSSRKPWPSTT
jgi:hypothetical protein